MTYYKHPDSDYLAAFLMTYRSFSTPKQLLDLLILRFDTPVPINCLQEDLQRFKEQRLTPIRLRVANVLKNWIDKHFHDFMEDRSLVASFLQFIKLKTDVDSVIEKTLDQVCTSPFLFFSFLFFFLLFSFLISDSLVLCCSSRNSCKGNSRNNLS